MKSNALSKLVWPAVLITLLLALGSGLLAQQQTVQCADPPGGTITCEKGQLATCTIVKGKVEGRCQTAPANLTQKVQLDAWVLSQVMSRPVGTAEVNKVELKGILKSGRWQTGDKVITFAMGQAAGAGKPF